MTKRQKEIAQKVFDLIARDTPPAKHVAEKGKTYAMDRIEEIETFLKKHKRIPKIKFIAKKIVPKYIHTKDRIELPALETFKTRQLYYHTVFHEVTHSTGHKDRLNRGLEKYRNFISMGMEEGIAEITALWMLSHFKLLNDKRIENSAWYTRQYLGGFHMPEAFKDGILEEADRAYQYLMESIDKSSVACSK